MLSQRTHFRSGLRIVAFTFRSNTAIVLSNSVKISVTIIYGYRMFVSVDRSRIAINSIAIKFSLCRKKLVYFKFVNVSFSN
jgi:hypothetical protein